MTSGRILKRLIIAEAIVNGSRIAAVARELGVSRSWASREANAPETRLVVADLFERNAEKINGLIRQALAVIQNGLDATKLLRSKTRAWEIVDHRTRLEAVHLFIRLMATGAFDHLPPPSRGSRPIPRPECHDEPREVDPQNIGSRPDYKVQFAAVRALIRILAKNPQSIPHWRFNPQSSAAD
jgi:hypothetical protein